MIQFYVVLDPDFVPEMVSGRRNTSQRFLRQRIGLQMQNLKDSTKNSSYATRAIEGGMQPKALQKLLGHASIKTTMDRYVHITTDSLMNTVHQIEVAYSN